MKFEKGHKKVGGKQKGKKNEKTLAWEGIGDYLINEGADRAREIMMQSKDEKFMLYFNTLLEYFKPKLARQELTGKDGEQLIPDLSDDEILRRINKVIDAGEKK